MTVPFVYSGMNVGANLAMVRKKSEEWFWEFEGK